jgi:ubiquinone biosynthesis protein
MSEQLGWRGALESLQQEAPRWGKLLPQLPRLLHTHFSRDTDGELAQIRQQLASLEQHNRRLTQFMVALMALFALGLIKLVLMH